MKILGVVPARMGSSRFPGKPLALIAERPMVEHVYRRANLFPHWDALYLATCDQPIAEFGESQNFPVIMTSDQHTRCLDRVAEAISLCDQDVDDTDIIVCVQGDEPMLEPQMITAAIEPLERDESVDCTVLAMAIEDEKQFYNPDTVKIIHDLQGNVLYTSRSPVPYCKTFTTDLGARRIYGIFAFRWGFLKLFNALTPSPLELVESCDSNRIMDHGYRQRIAPYSYKASFSVDSPSDLTLVESTIRDDLFWGKY